MKLNKILYGLVQSSLYWYNHLKRNFEARGVKTIPLDPLTFYERGMMAQIYVDGLVFFGPDQDNTDELIK